MPTRPPRALHEPVRRRWQARSLFLYGKIAESCCRSLQPIPGRATVKPGVQLRAPRRRVLESCSRKRSFSPQLAWFTPPCPLASWRRAGSRPTFGLSASPHRRSSTASWTTKRGLAIRCRSTRGCRTTRCEARPPRKRRRSGWATTPRRCTSRSAASTRQPGKIRTNISRRDNAFGDDWVGVSLDSSRAGQLAYHLFVNPSGIQMDALQSGSSGEDFAPDWVWQSAGHVGADGWSAEIRVPLENIRFRSGADVRMGVLFWRRLSRTGVSTSWPEMAPRQMGVRVECRRRVRRAAVSTAARDDSERDVLGQSSRDPIARGGTLRGREETSASA